MTSATIPNPMPHAQVGTASIGMQLVRQNRHHARKVFVVATIAHLVVSVVVAMVIQLNPMLSRDSIKYGMMGEELAANFAEGKINWSLWIDHGWYQLIGWVYYLIGPYLLVVQFMNAFAMGGAAVLIYRIGLVIFELEPTARAAAYVASLFPSALYFTSLPIKEAFAIFAVCGVIWGVLLIQSRQRAIGVGWITIGLLIVMSLRVYLVFVYLGCAALSLAPLHAKSTGHAIVVFCVWAGMLGLTFFAVANTFRINLDEYDHLKYFDLNYVNQVRAEMSTGQGKMFKNKADAELGNNLGQDILNAVTGTFFFFMSIDVLNVKSGRQAAAIPEMLFMLYCIPSLAGGIRYGWRNFPHRLLPLLVFTLTLVLVYGGAATNMGAMYRWRLQALPFLILLVFYGATVRRRGLLYRIVCHFAPRRRGAGRVAHS